MHPLQWRLVLGKFVSVIFIGFISQGIFCGNVHSSDELRSDLFGVSFVDEDHGWACGRWGRVLESTDGGKSWRRQNSGTDYTLSSVCFVDQKKGWAVGDMGSIIHTTDGGITWEKQKSPVPYFLMDVHFVDTQTGWIVTERTTILHTVDGGKTWYVQFSDEDFILKSVSFCDEQHGWAVGEYGYIYQTDDGGGTWEHQAGEFGFSEETGDIIAGNYLFDVVACTPTTAVVVGIEGYIARTVDGGTNWSQVRTDMLRAPIFGVTTVDGMTIAAAGKATLLMSRDRGNTFHRPEIEPSVKYGWLYGIAARGDKGFVAVGKSEWIYLSHNKAGTWQLAPVNQ